MNRSLSLNQLCQQHQCRLIKQDEHNIHLMSDHDAPPGLVESLRFSQGKTVYWHKPSETPCTTPQNPIRLSEDQFDDYHPVAEDDHVRSLLTQANQQRASDIHLEPTEHGLSVRLRIDGVLQHLTVITTEESAKLTTRLKVLAELDIAERRRPQDGQLTLTLHDVSLRFRLSTLPTQYGEKLVLRQIHYNHRPMTLDELGFTPSHLALFKKILSKPQGLILVTGPTGSGKTATLYSALNHLNSPAVNIASVEDPIEASLAGINQTAVNVKAGLTFDIVLRALLRQDPDIIMVGEIRDKQTASTAMHAAQTGHLVLSTLHTNSASETLSRLTQFGISPYLLASCLQLIIAQRLVRKLCPHCRQRYYPKQSCSPGKLPESFHHWQASGCQHCLQGYYGRGCVYEMLSVTDDIRQAILNMLPAHELGKLAQKNGMKSLWQTGVALAHQGETSLNELVRTLGTEM